MGIHVLVMGEEQLKEYKESLITRHTQLDNVGKSLVESRALLMELDGDDELAIDLVDLQTMENDAKIKTVGGMLTGLFNTFAKGGKITAQEREYGEL